MGRRDRGPDRKTWEAHTDARIPAPAGIARRLGIPELADTVRTRYRFLADGQPVLLLRSWEPMALTGTSPVLLPEAGPLAGAGVLARMRSIGVHVTRTTETPRPARATQQEANLLGIPLGCLVTRIERTHLTGEDLPVETADITVPDARADVSYELPAP